MDTIEAPQLIEHINKPLEHTPYDVKWVPSSARLVSMGIHTNGNGAIQIFELNKGECNIVSNIRKKSGIKCGTFGASSIEERHLATGDHNGTLAVYDLERPETAVFEQKAHLSIIMPLVRSRLPYHFIPLCLFLYKPSFLPVLVGG